MACFYNEVAEAVNLCCRVRLVGHWEVVGGCGRYAGVYGETTHSLHVSAPDTTITARTYNN